MYINGKAFSHFLNHSLKGITSTAHGKYPLLHTGHNTGPVSSDPLTSVKYS